MNKDQIKQAHDFIKTLGESHRGFYLHKVNFDGSFTTLEAISQADMSWMLTNATMRLQDLIKNGPSPIIEIAKN